MKKVIHICLIIVFLFAICLTEQLIINNCLEKTNNLVNNLKNIVETTENVNTNLIINKTNELKEFWTNQERILCTFINHKEIEDIGVEINNLESAIKENQRFDYIESINLISFFVKSYEHIIGINLQSIF